MNNNIKSLKVYTIFIALILPLNVVIHAQDIILLNDYDMNEYKLDSQVKIYWPISTDSLKSNIIEQRWRISEKDDIYIDYCEFDSKENAYKALEYTANSNSLPFIEGSPSGEIIGDASWVAIDGSAVYFQKDNFGIKIFKPLNLRPEDTNKIINISNKILAKISDDIP